MIPPLIVETALDLGINLIAITDHNSSANIHAVQKAADHTLLSVLPGMEVQTREDIHSLCLFDTLEQINTFQTLIDASLPSIKNRSDHFGAQYVVDETGELIREEEKLLISSCSLSLDETWKIVTDMGGLFIPAHINRKAFGLIESLGFVPTEITFEALEISRHITPTQAQLTIPSIGKTPLIQNGDVHRLDEFIGTLFLQIENPSISEIRMAFQGINGRFFEIRA
jgi:PHP family Zn ribbon phosphoesterase